MPRQERLEWLKEKQKPAVEGSYSDSYNKAGNCQKITLFGKVKLDAFLSDITETSIDADALNKNLAQMTAELVESWMG